MARHALAAVAGVAVAASLATGCGGRSSSTTSARPPVLRDFDPISFTAIGENDYWLLGTYRCPARGSCFTILRTTDGGKSFRRLDAPQLPLNGIVPYLRFADSRDGFAYVPWAGGVLYSTHDGGATWHRLSLGTVLAFATGGGNVYLVTAHCGRPSCSDYRLERSPVSSDRWTSTAAPFALGASIVSLAAHGPNVWMLGTAGSEGRMQHDTLARSADGGHTWTIGPGPCYPDLGGYLQPTSARVVWAICPTGMLAGAWRSTDGGVSFRPLKTRGLVNSAALAPASDTVAVLAANGAGAPLLRTSDGGASWHVVPGSKNVASWPFIGFTDASVGAAIVTTTATRPNELWRTTDGGRTWSALRVRLDG